MRWALYPVTPLGHGVLHSLSTCSLRFLPTFLFILSFLHTRLFIRLLVSPIGLHVTHACCPLCTASHSVCSFSASPTLECCSRLMQPRMPSNPRVPYNPVFPSSFFISFFALSFRFSIFSSFILSFLSLVLVLFPPHLPAVPLHLLPFPFYVAPLPPLPKRPIPSLSRCY